MKQCPVAEFPRNPALDDDQTHVATVRLKFVDGKLHQLWWPADANKHMPEWRLVNGVQSIPVASTQVSGVVG